MKDDIKNKIIKIIEGKKHDSIEIPKNKVPSYRLKFEDECIAYDIIEDESDLNSIFLFNDEDSALVQSIIDELVIKGKFCSVISLSEFKKKNKGKDVIQVNGLEEFQIRQLEEEAKKVNLQIALDESKSKTVVLYSKEDSHKYKVASNLMAIAFAGLSGKNLANQMSMDMNKENQAYDFINNGQRFYIFDGATMDDSTVSHYISITDKGLVLFENGEQVSVIGKDQPEYYETIALQIREMNAPTVLEASKMFNLDMMKEEVTKQNPEIEKTSEYDKLQIQKEMDLKLLYERKLMSDNPVNNYEELTNPYQPITTYKQYNLDERMDLVEEKGIVTRLEFEHKKIMEQQSFVATHYEKHSIEEVLDDFKEQRGNTEMSREESEVIDL